MKLQPFSTSALGGHCEEAGRKIFCLLIAWQYTRVIKSTITAETLAFPDAAEAGIFYFVLSQAMSVPEESIPIECYVDNRLNVEDAHSSTALLFCFHRKKSLQIYKNLGTYSPCPEAFFIVPMFLKKKF